MLAEIIELKPQFISGDSITLVNNQIKTIGQSYKFRNIKKLHLSYNIIQSLDGIEQFINLQHLSLTDNQIEQLKEFDRIPKSLQQLTVLNNPITANPNYEFQLMQMFPNLTHLNGEKFNRQKIYQLNDLMTQLGEQLFSYLSTNIDHNLIQILEDKQELSINKLLKVLQLYGQQQVKSENNISYKELLEHVIKYQQQNFKNNQLKVYLTQVTIEQMDLDLERFAQDEEYYEQQLLQTFIKDGFPIYPANKQYLLALTDFLIFKQKSIDITTRQNEDRIKPFTQNQNLKKQKSQTQLLQNSNQKNQQQENTTLLKDDYTTRIQNQQEQVEQQQQEEEQFQQDQRKQINFYKKQFKINKGLQLIKKVVYIFQLKQFIKQYPEYVLKRKQSNLTKIRDFVDIMNKYQQKQLKKSIDLLKQYKILHKFAKILNHQIFLNKGFNFFILKSIIEQINAKAIKQRTRYLIKNVFSILKPLRYQKKKVQLLQFKLLTFKFKALQREALMMIRIKQKQKKIQKLNNTIIRKRNQSFQNCYMDSIAVQQFIRQRDTLREFNY